MPYTPYLSGHFLPTLPNFPTRLTSPHPPRPNNTQHSATLPPPPAAQNKTPRSPCKFFYIHINSPLQEGVFLLHTQKKDPRPSVKTNSLTHSLVVKKKNKQKKKKAALVQGRGLCKWMHGCIKEGGMNRWILRLSSYIYIYQVNG